MLKSSFIISVALLFQLVVFSQPRKVIDKPSRPIPVRPVPPVYNPGNQQAKWFYIATTEVRLSGERDVVNLNSRDIFRAIKFNVTRNALEVFDLSVVFDNGRAQKFTVRNIFQPGTGSRVLDLPGNKRRIRSLVFTYRTRGHLFSQRAHVMIYGLK
ncbi:MAG: hypothetical protein ABIU63_16195 [Chitinophagaceae bacterium]